MTSIARPMTAYLSNGDSPDIRNPIHSTEVAQKYGFGGALVAGVTIYGWAAEVALAELGDTWLDDGWAEVAFRRPIYPAEPIVIRFEDDVDGHRLAVEGEDGSVRMEGRVGLGTAPWFAELTPPASLDVVAPDSIELTPLTIETAPVGTTLLPIGLANMDVDAARAQAETQRSSDTRFTDGGRLHPAMLAGYTTSLAYGQFAFTPGIHVSSRVQHLGRADAAPGYLVTGRIVDVSARNGRHRATIDGSLVRDGREISRARLGLIFAIETPA